ncbi:TPA: tyrosine-type recombinase/integrase [Morganella morganii]|nr:tyrosine-type recombinase/integrase [Morganella morganii]
MQSAIDSIASVSSSIAPPSVSSSGITGIGDFRFHGLKYTRASRLIQSGVPLSVLQETGGWESTKMVPDTGFELVTFSLRMTVSGYN